MAENARKLAIDAIDHLGTDDEEAVRLFREAVANAGDQEDVLVSVASHLYGLGFYDEAIAAITRAKRLLDETSRADVLSRAAFLSARMATTNGPFAEAEDMLRKGVDAFPDQAAWPHTLANFLADQGRTDEAVDVLADAVSRHPRDAQLQELHRRLAEATRDA